MADELSLKSSRIEDLVRISLYYLDGYMCHLQERKWLVKLLYMDGLENLGPLSHQTKLVTKNEDKDESSIFKGCQLSLELSLLLEDYICNGIEF